MAEPQPVSASSQVWGAPPSIIQEQELGTKVWEPLTALVKVMEPNKGAISIQIVRGHRMEA